MQIKRGKLEYYKDKILEYYYSGLTALDISKKIPYHNSTISKFLRGKGLKTLPSRVPPKVIQEIRDYYLEGNTIKATAQKYCVTEGFVNFHLKQMGVTRRRGKMPIVNEEYFSSIDTEKKAYFLGFMFADGYIKKTHSYLVQLMLREEDGYIIKEFKKELKTDREVKIYKRVERDGRERRLASLRVSSPVLYNDLLSLGMRENPLENHRPVPVLPENLLPHFVRGYFDGNGSVFLSLHKKSGTISLGSNFTGDKGFLGELNMLLKPITNSSGKVFDRGNFGSIHFAQRQTINLYHYMYEGATICLLRKKEKFENFLRERED